MSALVMSPSKHDPVSDDVHFCGVCWEQKTNSYEMETLPCRHSFCSMCISHCNNATCPLPGCTASRRTAIVIDHGIEDVPLEINGNVPSILDCEEKFPCQARRGRNRCPGVARMVMQDCRHRICFDCLGCRVQYAIKNKEMPNCAHPRCANKLTKPEILRVAEMFPKIRADCMKVISQMPKCEEDIYTRKEELSVACSVQGRPHTLRRFCLPLRCTMTDLVNGVFQLQRMTRQRDSTAVYLMTEKENERAKYQPVDLHTCAKKPIKEMTLPDKVHLVIDVDNLLSKRR
ncbi:unnamed protein product, partial [Mesorhabditis spiculigera]